MRQERNLVLNNEMRMNDIKKQSLAFNNDDGKNCGSTNKKNLFTKKKKIKTSLLLLMMIPTLPAFV